MLTTTSSVNDTETNTVKGVTQMTAAIDTQNLLNAFDEFIQVAGSFLVIEDEQGYQRTLDTLEQVLENAQDSETDPLNPLIDLLSNAIESYESKDQQLVAFIAEANALPADITLLKTLMKNHHLTGSDLPEIGGKAMVSKVLKGERHLSRQAIEQLALRFDINPGLFFNC